ncbi:hypothetical protein [Longimicrobium sp.]|uniref:hypothetical protein n=1 Tax=Longimicrobium sp. TaxID=2029185 RepID=UPI002E34B4FE|nr:hypothetical protein [Longimicrobium sp.]HEX6040289.1 hypothetical protein [Longimicrobium sp.]
MAVLGDELHDQRLHTLVSRRASVATEVLELSARYPDLLQSALAYTAVREAQNVVRSAAFEDSLIFTLNVQDLGLAGKFIMGTVANLGTSDVESMVLEVKSRGGSADASAEKLFVREGVSGGTVERLSDYTLLPPGPASARVISITFEPPPTLP